MTELFAIIKEAIDIKILYRYHCPIVIHKRDEHTMHHHKTHHLVKTTLKKVAKENKLPYSKVKRLFAFHGNPCITHQFWETLKKMKPEHNYIDVYHCPGCGQFDLE